ncbi:MAG TPA: hypothetical protein DEH25_17720 [Chloroflexi bacterium]|nr:hypothetical protein [Chloroflexota bacterium]HBY09561.1 hypothetical protein [Chloroflexota bacterium]
MKKTGLLFIGMITGTVLTLSFIFMAPSQSSLAESSNANPLVAGAVADFISEIGTATPSPSYSAGDDELPPANLDTGGFSVNVLPTPVPGESTVFFIPTDNDATATVLYLYNTDTVAHIVALRGFSYNGVLVYSLNVNVGATSFLRLASDSIASAPPPSWATPAPVITNFTDFTYFASLSLPKGVKVEGYTLYNPGTGVVDPRKDQGAVPLRFSTDPASLFLPTVTK